MKLYLAVLMLISFVGSLKSMEEQEIRNDLVYSVEEIYKSIRKCSCDIRFTCYNDMLTHIFGCHVSFNANEYMCKKKDCNMKTSSPHTLILHFPEHTKEVIKICSSCHFNITMQLSNHDSAHAIYERILKKLSKKDLMPDDLGKLHCPIPKCKNKYVKLMVFLKHLNSHPEFNMLKNQEINFLGEPKKPKPIDENSLKVIEITPADIELLFLEEYYLNSDNISHEFEVASDSTETQNNSSEVLKDLQQNITTLYDAIGNNDHTKAGDLNEQANLGDSDFHYYTPKKRKITHENQ